MILLNEWREPPVLASVDKLFQLIAPLYLKLLLRNSFLGLRHVKPKNNHNDHNNIHLLADVSN